MSYPWPASAISEDEMALLFRAREASVKHMPITELLRRAVIQTYGKETALVKHHDEQNEPMLKAA